MQSQPFKSLRLCGSTCRPASAGHGVHRLVSSALLESGSMNLVGAALAANRPKPIVLMWLPLAKAPTQDCPYSSSAGLRWTWAPLLGFTRPLDESSGERYCLPKVEKRVSRYYARPSLAFSAACSEQMQKAYVRIQDLYPDARRCRPLMGIGVPHVLTLRRCVDRSACGRRCGAA